MYVHALYAFYVYAQLCKPHNHQPLYRRIRHDLIGHDAKWKWRTSGNTIARCLSTYALKTHKHTHVDSKILRN